MRFRHCLVAFSTLLALSSATASLLPLPKQNHTVIDTSARIICGIAVYEQNYLMETFSNKNYNYPENMRHDEIKFQIDVALPLWKGILGENSVLTGAYTQRSWFQFSNQANLRHSVESNYQPQLFVAWATDYDLPFGWKLVDVETGVVHTSNGRSDQQLKSRSWNRL